MGQSIIAVVLTILFYITSLFGGGTSNTSVPNQYQYTPSQQEQSSSSIIGQTAVVLGNKVTVRSGPGTDYTAVSSVDKGLEVTLLEAKDGWYKVRFASGQNGWIAGYLLNVLPYSSVLKNSTSGKMVLGYYLLNNQSYESMLENSQVLTGIAPWSWELDSYGGLQASFDEEKLGETLQFAGNKGLETYALIHNLQNGYFDSQTATNLLNNSIAQERAINNIYQTLLDWGMKGVNIDLENVPAKDRELLTDFIRKLSQKLRTADLITTIAVPAKTVDDLNNNFSGAYDYEALSQYADYIVIMAYDQHYSKGDPGPISSIEWVEQVIDFALSKTSKDKIILGIPGYGYNWSKTGGTGVTYEQAMELAAQEGVSVKWHSQYKVPYFSYGNGNQVWFENRYSTKYKLDLVKKYDLAGIALWRLGQEDPAVWETISKAL